MFGTPLSPDSQALIPQPRNPASAGFVNVPGPLATALAPTTAPKPKINWLGVLADALAGAAGRQGPYATMMMQQRQQSLEGAQQQAQSDRELQRQKDLYQFELDHPRPQMPTETERLMHEYLDPSTPPDRKALIGQQLIKPQAVTVTNPDGSQELRFIYPGQQGAQAPTAPVGKLTLIDGGQTASPSGGFPR